MRESLPEDESILSCEKLQHLLKRLRRRLAKDKKTMKCDRRTRRGQQFRNRKRPVRREIYPPQRLAKEYIDSTKEEVIPQTRETAIEEEEIKEFSDPCR